jgi:3-dehydroquinate synthase
MPDDPQDSKAASRVSLTVSVPVDAPSYPVVVGEGLLDEVGSHLRGQNPAARRVALVSDDNVMPLYGDRLTGSLEREGLEVRRFSVPAGEASKTPQRLIGLVEGFLGAGLSRNDVVVALGGGVVGDLAGFAAASFMRGVPFLQCPTSLLAQVDASVGGKVAVDLPSGKNLMGAFHFPTAVLIDPAVLSTLSDRELGCGLAEMLKHGMLFSSSHFEQLVSEADAIYGREESLLTRLVAASVELKAACVSRDPREREAGAGGRVLLNLGHTVGHALEHLSNYELAHGEAVGLGLRAACRLSARRGLCPPRLEAQVTDALKRLRLPRDLDAWLSDTRAQGLEGALSTDKKRGYDEITYIALAGLGDPRVLSLPPTEIVSLLQP